MCVKRNRKENDDNNDDDADGVFYENLYVRLVWNATFVLWKMEGKGARGNFILGM